ncbi:MAG: GNAT family N-acetyltransferase [Lachnospiraceae bacterium]|nr:GNAT family N-acetyltransferase [Lachnospiraceae bacterium]
MNKPRLFSLVPDSVTNDLLKECCDLFNSNFEKSINGINVKVFPNRMRKYLNNNSAILCLRISCFLIGYMIVEKITNDLIWIKQIVIAKEFRNNGFATQLVERICNFKFIGIITNNPIMIKILKEHGFTISQDSQLYKDIYENFAFKKIVDLYKIDYIIKRETNFVALTNLVNLQEISGNIYLYPLTSIEDGYEWIALFCNNCISQK